jgi:hypothetical protein
MALQMIPLPRVVRREGVVVAQHIREGRFQRSLALIAALSSLLGGLDVTYEHYRGSYSQRVMYSPIIITPLLALAGVWAAFNRRVARTLLPLASAALLVDGVIGFVFHVRGIARKPGGWRLPLLNLIMGPPVFAPLLLGVGGFLGLIASLLRREDDPPRDRPTPSPVLLDREGVVHRALVGKSAWSWLPRGITREGVILDRDVREGRFQRLLAGAMGVSAILNGAEVWYSHYKNRFSYRVQWTPIILTPFLIVAGFGAVISRRIARTLLPITSLLAIINGTVGFLFHARGVARRPGNPRQIVYNVAYGPPIFAPLLFAATGFMGILAALLRRASQ